MLILCLLWLYLLSILGAVVMYSFIFNRELEATGIKVWVCTIVSYIVTYFPFLYILENIKWNM